MQTYGYAMTVVACSGEQLVGSIVGIYTVPIKHDLAAGFSKINVQDFQSPTATRKRKGKKTSRLRQIFFHTVREETVVCFRDFVPRFRAVISTIIARFNCEDIFPRQCRHTYYILATSQVILTHKLAS